MLVFSCKNLSKPYGGRTLFSQISLDLYHGIRVGLVGCNGVGKSNLLHSVVRIHTFDADFNRALTTFSGGQQSRVMLAKLLLSAPDVMLLDEPSNHLDIKATEWLEGYLSRQREAMLIVSHDRTFLNNVVTTIFELSER